MPFKKVGSDDYTSPSGRHFNKAQVRLYYAHDGFPGEKKAKGGLIKPPKAPPPRPMRHIVTRSGKRG